MQNYYNTGFTTGLTTSNLNVRSGPGTNYKVKKIYKNGTRFDTFEIVGDFARTPSGGLGCFG
jgi:SH3-like domain-containing protein